MTYTPTVFRDIWADEDLHLIIDRTDVTYFRGVPVQVGGYQLTEPFTYGPASFAFPQVTPFELKTANTGELAWLNDGKPARLVKVNEGAIVATVWRGFITRRSTDGSSVTVHCDGDASGRLALADVQPTLKWRKKDVGELVFQAFKKHNIPFTPRFGPTTGIVLDNQGGDSDYLSFTTENLSLAQELSGTQWTCGVVDNQRRRYTMYEKDRTTVHATVFLGAQGVTLDVSDDLSEKPNTVFGHGEVKGDKWWNVVRPMRKNSPPPDFPMPSGQVMEVGTHNADTTTGDGITVLHNRLLATGDITRAEFGGGLFGPDTEDAVKAVQRQAGIKPATGKVNARTWKKIYDVRVTGRSKRGTRIVPLAVAERVREWDLTATGALAERNDEWDKHAVPVHLTVEYPPGVKKSRARKWSRRVVDESGDPNWTGTLTLDGHDVFVGNVDHGTATPVPMSRLDIREGQNVMVRGFDGDTLFHISAVDVASDKTVKLLIDTKARDAMTLAAIRERNYENKMSPDRRRRRAERRRDRKIAWGEGAGVLDTAEQVAGGTWTVFTVGAGDEGRVRKLHLELTANTEFAVAIFGERVTRKMLAAQIGNPLRDTGGAGWLRNKALVNRLEDHHSLVYAAGTNARPCGYWPGSKLDDNGEASGDPVTGEFGNRSGFRYETADNPVLYVAIWSRQTCKVRAGRILWRAKSDQD